MYHRIYSRGTAGAIGAAGMLALVLTQLVIVAEAVASLRPTWTVWQSWGAAAGFEFATFAVGMIGAVAGFSPWMRVALAAFLAVSTFFGFDGSMQAQLGGQFTLTELMAADPMQWARAIVEGSFQPVMYLGLVFSVHRLYAAEDKTPAPARRQAEARRPVEADTNPNAWRWQDEHAPAVMPAVPAGPNATAAANGNFVRPVGGRTYRVATAGAMEWPSMATNGHAPEPVVVRPPRRRARPDWEAVAPAIRRAVFANPAIGLDELAGIAGAHKTTVLRRLPSMGVVRGEDGWLRVPDAGALAADEPPF